jgi:hypothetical protein
LNIPSIKRMLSRKNISGNKKAKYHDDNEARTRLAKNVVVGSLVAIGVLAFSVILVSLLKKNGEESSQSINQVFNSLLPLLGTWVGTVLAYYFSRDNFESANRSVREIVDRITPREVLQKHEVQNVMIPTDKMTVVRMAPNENEVEINIKERILNLFGGLITRLLVLDSTGIAKYMIHQSMVYKFISEKSIEATEKNRVFDVSQANLKDFIDHKNMLDIIGPTTFGFVSISSTLAEAKDEMDSIEGCQDIFVTKYGKSNEPVLGWITNIEISKCANASMY